MEVRDMLSVLSVQGVEKRIGEVPGVESVTVNFAAGSATVRFDETRLSLADIRSDVRQIGSKDDAADDGGKEPEEPDAPSAVTQPVAVKAPPSAASADASSPDKDAMKGMKGTP
ncbi:MAG: heavy-metal-associated domain-containing protein [Hydrogenophaga sp.]|nr:heavy-metal-associated domain-containing protein [Hydrogenophaga sp.]